MDKNAILKKSRQEKKDEGQIFILSEGCRCGSSVIMGMLALLLTFTLITLRTVELSLLLSLVWGYLAGYFYGCYQKMPEKGMFMVYVSSLVTIASLAFYIVQVV